MSKGRFCPKSVSPHFWVQNLTMIQRTSIHQRRRCNQDNGNTHPKDLFGRGTTCSDVRVPSTPLFLVIDDIPGTTSQPIDGALSVDDLVSGTIIALALALTVSFLRSRRSQDDLVLWTNNDTLTINNCTDTTTNTIDTASNNITTCVNTTVFNGSSWKEMSRPENYVLFNTRLRQRGKSKTVDVVSVTKLEERNVPPQLSTRQSKKTKQSAFETTTERRIVLVALLLLFVPIFSVEFFFALSRQLICGGDPLQQSDWAVTLCSPAY
jgi:hypothetical protein